MRAYFSIRRAIPGYEGLYSATTDGRIYSEKSKIYLKPRLDDDGYYRVNLHKDSIMKTSFVHRLVAQTWIKNPENLPQINHKNEVKTDNRVSNLEWCDAKYNINYGSRTAKCSKMVRCIELDRTFPSIAAAARELCINSYSLSQPLRAHNGKCYCVGYHWEYTNVEEERKNK